MITNNCNIGDINMEENNTINSIKFHLLFKINNCVANGDPNADAQQRVGDDGHGYITDVCFNHFLRQYMMWKGYDIVFDGKKTAANFGGMSTETALKNFVDIRLFGAMIRGEVNKKDENSEEPELDENEEKTKKGKKGAKGSKKPRSKEEKKGDACISATRSFNMTVCKTLEPIFPKRNAITRCMKSRDDADQNSTMGSQPVVEEAVFALNAVLSGRQAEKNGVTQNDIELLKEAVRNWTKVLEGPRAGRVEIIFFSAEECDDNLVPAHLSLEWAKNYRG